MNAPPKTATDNFPKTLRARPLHARFAASARPINPIAQFEQWDSQGAEVIIRLKIGLVQSKSTIRKGLSTL
jgi:hypothetical protein